MGKVLLGKVQSVQDAVGDRGDHDADDDEKDGSGIKCVKRSEKLAGRGADRIDRAHSSENHGGIEKGIEPREFFGKVIAQDSAAQGKENDGQTKKGVAGDSAEEFAEGQERLGLVLEHGGRILSERMGQVHSQPGGF